MEGLEVLFSILCLVLLGFYIYLLWRQYASIGKALILSLGLVMLESHLFHVFFFGNPLQVDNVIELF